MIILLSLRSCKPLLLNLAANLSRLAVETYVDSNYANIADTMFKNGKEDQLDPNLLLSELEKCKLQAS